MKINKLCFLIVLGFLAAVCGIMNIGPIASNMVACCDPETDEDCSPPPSGPGGGNGDSMPIQIIG